MRAARLHFRCAWAVALALLLAVRSLAPAGFMPAFDNGVVTIVACPDGAFAPAIAMHHDGDPKGLHQPCPYGAVSGLGAVAPNWAPLLVGAVFAALLLLGRTFTFIERHGRRDRPPAIGPPSFPA